MKNRIDKIYEVIANKEFTNWCKIVYNPIKNDILLNYQYITTSILTTKVAKDDLLVNPLYHYFTPVKIKRLQVTKIIWHPILIWDIMHWILENQSIDSLMDIMKNLPWRKLRKPIEKQSEECIDYIYNLINNEK